MDNRRRVVVTGVGVVSSIGNDFDTLTESLKLGRSGIRAVEAWSEYGLTSRVAGLIDLDESKIQAANIPLKLRKAMPTSTLYCSVAASDAVTSSRLTPEELADPKTACLVGSGVADVSVIHREGVRYFDGQVRRSEPYTVLKSMSSTASAILTKLFGITGRSYSISSACATGAHNIGHAYELIRDGVIDRAVTGGCEEVNELIVASFQALRMALSTGFNDTPETASRPYDRDRDGFVISGGAGVLVLESLDSALARNAPIYAEIAGYAANSDPYDLVLPQADGGTFVDCISSSLEDAGISSADVDAINTHGTGTGPGDVAEVNGLRRAFGEKVPRFSSTKSMTGHAIGAVGAIELIACIAMLKEGFIAPSINIENIDPLFADAPIVRETTPADLKTVLSLNFGFGGTNAATVLRKMD
ncbi:3-oxoacyl-[acyl-carrier-protein] synthase 1 [Grimontia celer]|uniref:3-oxoacyl-[acyl-carrier-protein] synthase 1 n=1 Tax=Grimontia celer TaxID=1796497 RepID=A0A128F8E4_9GAMM|nr:beta-ketoacyl-[acyl-carrier-protein] synthase family protein [Grimontia celer]CZF83018.1 3-oxoacyl-[acyl-carrier-protein] synthase 1 [Grimontia celer]